MPLFAGKQPSVSEKYILIVFYGTEQPVGFIQDSYKVLRGERKRNSAAPHLPGLCGTNGTMAGPAFPFSLQKCPAPAHRPSQQSHFLTIDQPVNDSPPCSRLGYLLLSWKLLLLMQQIRFFRDKTFFLNQQVLPQITKQKFYIYL